MPTFSPVESESGRPQRPSISDADRQKFATSFDTLIESNLRLTEACSNLTGSVARLVRTLYVAFGLTGAGVGLWAMLHR
jgi:hypothetical protein